MNALFVLHAFILALVWFVIVNGMATLRSLRSHAS